MNELFKSSCQAETNALKALNEAYYETDSIMKPLRNRTAKTTTNVALRSVYSDYFLYQRYYKEKTATDYSYFFESIIDTLKSYLDYCNLVLN